MLSRVFHSVWLWWMGNRSNGSDEERSAHLAETETPNKILCEIFEKHGVSSVAVEKWIEFPGHHYRALANVLQEWRPTPTTVTVQLDIIFDLGPGEPIVESFAGIGANRQRAILEAFGNFAVGSLHVLLAAFFGTGAEQVRWDQWELSGRTWHAIIGPPIIRGRVPDAMPSPTTWISKLRKSLSVEPLTGDVHWLRLYFAQMDSRPLELEVLSDNQAYPPLIETFDESDWQPSPNFYGVRLFLILLAQDMSPVAEFPSGPMDQAPPDACS